MEVGYQAVAQAKGTWSGSVKGHGSQGHKASFEHPIRTREVVRSCQSVGTCQQPRSTQGHVSRNQSALGEIVCENPSVIERKTTCAKAAAYSSNRLSSRQFDQGLLKKDAHAMGTPSHNPPLVNHALVQSWTGDSLPPPKSCPSTALERGPSPDGRHCVQSRNACCVLGTPCNGRHNA